MRVSREKFAENRAAILEAAAELFRQKGFDGVGVADIMRAAGLTHGGFYGHFASKDDLAAEASRHAAGASAQKWAALREARGEAAGEAVLAAIIDAYLSPRHRDEPGHGCVLAALGAEAARQPGAIRSALGDAFAAQVDVLAQASPGRTEAERRQAALRLYSELVGAIVLSRIAAEPGLSLDILNASRTGLGLPALPAAPDGETAPSDA